MLKSHEKFHSSDGRRHILIVDDEAINRQMLGMIIEQEYKVSYAENGREALEIIEENKDVLSLVLLDLMMPEMSGEEVLHQMKENTSTKDIPVIVVTTDQEAEVRSLSQGASDFISKPYPRPDVIMARILRTIELNEDRETINATERDPLTGLYNKEYFFKYAVDYDTHHKNMEMDAIIIDVNHFHMLNERYGKKYGDEILRRIGQRIRALVSDEDGIVCRREADAFLVYRLHRDNYEQLLEDASIGIEEDGQAGGTRVRLRMGVYSCVDKNIHIERRFDRAKMAADTIRNNYNKRIAVYDSILHETELYAEQLTSDFQTAINERQFKVFYQPKFNITREEPVLSSAEALVRWEHPELGMISPGVFIPLFEENGMILQLDQYVWREAAAQIRAWKDKYGAAMPVSVNISRIDMLDDKLVDRIMTIVTEAGLEPNTFLLEITESAYTEDSERIVTVVKELRRHGFKIEMDDFGTGYSSLGMISSLPIDALKLDMLFVRNAFNEKEDLKMLGLIMDLAEHLEVPVIAEGVETADQLRALRTMGCHMAQGYYFSKPIPAHEFEHFIAEKREQEKLMGAKGLLEAEKKRDKALHALKNISSAMNSGYETTYYVNTKTGNYVEFGTPRWNEALQMQRGGDDFFGDVSRDIDSVIYEEDREKVRQALSQDSLMQRLEQAGSFSLTYRLLIGDSPIFYRMQASRSDTAEGHHVVIGIKSVEEQTQLAVSEAQAQAEDIELYGLAQAMAHNYETIYYIDMETDAYTVFNTSGLYGDLEIETSGIHFFEDCQNNLIKVVYQADQPLVAEKMQKDKLIKDLLEHGEFNLDYRLVFDGQPLFYRMTGFLPEVGDDHHFMIGVHNVDAEKSQEQRFANAEEASATYARIAQALTQDFFTVYYVNVENNHYVEYSMEGRSHQLQIERTGTQFFKDCRKQISDRVVPEDRHRMVSALDKDTLLHDVDANGTISITYQVRGYGKLIHVALKALRLADDPTHLVIGMRNIDAQVRRDREYAAALEQSVTYSRIAQALAADYFSVYLVDTKTDQYIEYSSNKDYQGLKLAQSGEHFFEETRANIMKLVYPDDKERALTIWEKERLMPTLKTDGTVSVTYRLMMNGEPIHINSKVIHLAGADDSQIIVAISNVEAQMRREMELDSIRQKANRDALTGVKSKHAFVEDESRWDERIAGGESCSFAVVVCDVNGLKEINDSLGHKAGDRYIKEASMLICNVFKHSPVYRIGGDEFAVILTGADYDAREDLMREMEKISKLNQVSGDVMLACGVAEMIPGQDKTIEEVFERADVQMYLNKTEMKDSE